MVDLGLDARCYSADLPLLGSANFLPAWGNTSPQFLSLRSLSCFLGTRFACFRRDIPVLNLFFMSLGGCVSWRLGHLCASLVALFSVLEGLQSCCVRMWIKRSWFLMKLVRLWLDFGVAYLHAVKFLSAEGLRERWRSRLRSRGCLGSCTKPTPIIAVDEPSKGLRIQGRTVKKPSLSEDFWSTSTYEMDNSGIQSQRSISSISTSAQTVDPHGAAGSTSNPTEFVNHGLLLWNQTRQQWVGNRKPQTRSQLIREPRLSWNATYDNLLGTNKPFPHPIPLSEMVDFLVDVWEQDGMYD